MIRLKLFKIGSVIKVSVRPLVLHLWCAYIPQELFKLACQRLGRLTTVSVVEPLSG